MTWRTYSVKASAANTQTGTWSQKQTLVTTKDLVRGTSIVTSYLYSRSGSGELNQPSSGADTVDLAIPVEQTITYQDTTGSIVRTVNKAWVNAQQLQSEQITLETGQTSQTTYTYDPGSQLHEKDEYDYGQSTPARKTMITHQSFPVTPIFPNAASILDRPCSVITYDSSGNRVAETDYIYDGGTAVCGTLGTSATTDVSNLPAGSHDETNYAASSTAPREYLNK